MWELRRLSYGNYQIAELMEQGWEPLAIAPEVYSTYYNNTKIDIKTNTWVFLRRQTTREPSNIPPRQIDKEL